MSVSEGSYIVGWNASAFAKITQKISKIRYLQETNHEAQKDLTSEAKITIDVVAVK